MGGVEYDRSVMAPILTAAVLIWSGIHMLALYLDASVVGPELYMATQLISAATLMWASWSSISAGDVHRGIISMMVGLSAVTAISGTLTGHGDPLIHLSFVVPLTVSAIIIYRDRLGLECLGTIVLTLSMIAMSVDHLTSAPASGALLMLSGIAFALSSVFRRTARPVPPASAYRTLCLELMSVQASMTVLSKGMIFYEYTGASVSVSIAIASAFMLNRGMVIPGCCAALYSMIALMLGFPVAGEEGLEMASLPVLSTASVMLGAVAFVGKYRTEGTGLMAFGIGMAAWYSTGSATGMIIGSAVFSLLCALGAMSELTGPSCDKCADGLLGSIAGASTAGMLILSVTMIADVSSAIAMQDRGVFDHVTLIGCVFLIGFSAMAVKGRMITESALFLMAGLYMLMDPISGIMVGDEDALPVGISLTIGFAVAAYAYWRMGNPIRSAGCTLMTASALMTSIVADDLVPVILMTFSGILFLAVSLKKTVRFGVTGDAKMESRANLIQSENQYATVLVMSICLIILMIASFVTEASNLVSGNSVSLDIFRILLLCTILGFGLYSMANGFTTVSVFLLGSFVVSMLSTAMSMTGHSLPLVLKLLSSVVFIPVVLSFHHSGNRLMTAISLLLLLGLTMGPFLEMSGIFDLIIIFFRIATGVIAVTLWIEYDVGRIIVPRYSRIWRKDLISEGPVRAIPPCVLFSCMALASLTAVWLGIGTLTSCSSTIEFHVAVSFSSAICAVMSTWLFRTGTPEWGALIMLLAVGAVANSMSMVLTGDSDVDIPVCVSLVALAIISAYDRHITVAILSAAVSASLMLLGWMPAVGSVIMASVGIAFALIGAKGMISGRSWIGPSDSGPSVTISMVGTVSLCVYMIGTECSLIASVLASTFLMATALGCGGRGRYAESLALLSVALPGLAHCSSALAGAELSPIPLIIPAVLMLVSAHVLREDGDRLRAWICIAGGIFTLISVITGVWATAVTGSALASLSVMLSRYHRTCAGGDAPPKTVMEEDTAQPLVIEGG